MDKYLIIILMFLIAGMGIGITRDPPVLGLFYSMMAGAIIVIIYSSLQTRKEKRDLNKKRRSKK